MLSNLKSEIKNIIIVTSCLECKAYSAFDRNTRFEQTKKTLFTIKQKIPNSFIILIEKTNLKETKTS